MASTVSTLALVFFLFVSINQLTYTAIFQVANFMAILDRIGSVLRLEEFKSSDNQDNYDTNRANQQNQQPALEIMATNGEEQKTDKLDES